MLPSNFKGVQYRLSNNWFSKIAPFKGPIRQAEIGTLQGANLFSVAALWANHPESKMIAIDPWLDYSEYPEYKGEQKSIQETFCENLENSEHKSKIEVRRGFSHEVLPTLEDNSFDLIQIDGNHEPEQVLEDAVLAFRKVKVGGYLIFDDQGWGGPDMTKAGIDAFIRGYHKRIKFLGTQDGQAQCVKVC